VQDANDDRTDLHPELQARVEAFRAVTVPLQLSRHFSRLKSAAPQTSRSGRRTRIFTNPETRENLKKLVADAEAQADEMLFTQHTTCRPEDCTGRGNQRQLGQIDWDS